MDHLTLDQINEWEAYDRIDPIGNWTKYFRTAKLESTITNLAIRIHGKEGKELTTPLDFMPNWEGGEKEEELQKEQSVEDMKQIMMSVAGIQNKKVTTRNRPPMGNTKGL